MIQEFVQQIEETAQETVDNIHTALPGKVISYDAMKCTAKVKPIGRFLTPEDELMDYPIITDVPVMFPFCAKVEAGIFFPVTPGDFCLLVCSEAELDEWRTNAISDATLRFDLTSAIMIPGLLKKGTGFTKEADNDNAVIISSKETKIKAEKEKVETYVKNTLVTTVKKGQVEIIGDVNIKGNVTCTGDVVARGKSLVHHTHTGVHGGTSAPN